MNKKVVFVILLFIGISFIVYSFANPLVDEDNKMSFNDSNENDNYFDRDDTEMDKNDVVDNLDSNEKDDDENEKDDSGSEDNITDGSNKPNSSSTSTITRPITGSGNNRPTIPNIVPGNSTGNNSGGSSGSSGNNGNSNNSGSSSNNGNTGNNGSSGNNSGSGNGSGDSSQTKPDPKPPVKPTISFGKEIQLDDDPSIISLEKSSEQVNIKTGIADIVLSGKMTQKTKIPGECTSGFYITLKIYVPNGLENLNSVKSIKVTDSSINKVTRQVENFSLQSDAKGKFIVWNQEFNYGEKYSMDISWNENAIATYHVTYNIKTQKNI